MLGFSLRFAVLVLIVSLSALASAADTAGVTRVELALNEVVENRHVAWPVTTGVPFPQGKLVRSEQCRLVDDRGDEQPLQSRGPARSLGSPRRWHAPLSTRPARRARFRR